jgi:hypothetical protein
MLPAGARKLHAFRGDVPMSSLCRAHRVTTHDFSHRGWGHDYSFTPADGGLRGRVVGWCQPKPMEGDYLILQNDSGTTRYRVDAVRHPSAQGDQFFADVTFAPRGAVA